jgi:hypothetical protein
MDTRRPGKKSMRQQPALVSGDSQEPAQGGRLPGFLAAKFLQRHDQHTRILDMAHLVMKFTKRLDVLLRHTRQNRLEQFDHITETFEGNAQAMNGFKVICTTAGMQGSDFGKGLIHRLDQIPVFFRAVIEFIRLGTQSFAYCAGT